VTDQQRQPAARLGCGALGAVHRWQEPVEQPPLDRFRSGQCGQLGRIGGWSLVYLPGQVIDIIDAGRGYRGDDVQDRQRGFSGARLTQYHQLPHRWVT
jgi:hypothetical protein